MKIWCIILAFVCGAIFPLQAGLNNRFTKVTINPIVTTFFSVMVGFIAIAAYVIISRTKLPTLTTISAAPWYVWIAGVLGTIYVASVIFLIPRLGLAFTFSLIVAGQIIISIVLDHLGTFGPQQSFSLTKVAGAALVVLGVIIVRYK